MPSSQETDQDYSTASGAHTGPKQKKCALNCPHKLHKQMSVNDQWPKWDTVCHDNCYITDALHTFLNSSSTTGFSETVALSDRTTEADIHKALSVRRQRCTARQHHTNSPTKQLPYLLKDNPVQTTQQSLYCTDNTLVTDDSDAFTFFCFTKHNHKNNWEIYRIIIHHAHDDKRCIWH